MFFVFFTFHILALAGLDFSGIRVPPNNGGNGNGGNVGIGGPASTISIGVNDDPAAVRDAFYKNPDQLSLLKQNNPTLADALFSGDLGELKKISLSYLQNYQIRNLLF